MAAPAKRSWPTPKGRRLRRGKPFCSLRGPRRRWGGRPGAAGADLGPSSRPGCACCRLWARPGCR
eukprot:1554501-Alexandrium_andersonii.AAC.1